MGKWGGKELSENRFTISFYTKFTDLGSFREPARHFGELEPIEVGPILSKIQIYLGLYGEIGGPK